MDFQPGNCIWQIKYSSRVCVGMYELTYSIYHPRGCSLMILINIKLIMKWWKRANVDGIQISFHHKIPVVNSDIRFNLRHNR